MAIRTVTGPLKLIDFSFDRHHIWVGNFLTVFVTGGANRDRHIRRQSPQRAGPGDIDVACCAFQHVCPPTVIRTVSGPDSGLPSAQTRAVTS